MIDEDELSSDAITRDFRIFQRRRGHRYSLDDLATAAEAVEVRPEAATYVDLGCGIGSVLLMVTWRLSRTRAWGIEALAQSIELARRSVSANGLVDRVTLLHGDLRDLTESWPFPRAELVTGTPPYLPKGTALISPDEQRAAARIELRGGVEAYLRAAARIVAPDGRVVVCADGRHPERVLRGAAGAGLVPLRCRDVVARAGSGPLFAVWTLRPRSDPEREVEPVVRTTITIRDGSGERTAEGIAMRARFGL